MHTNLSTYRFIKEIQLFRTCHIQLLGLKSVQALALFSNTMKICSSPSPCSGVHIGATLGQHWGNIGATLWPYYGHVGATLGPHWGHIRATLGATLGQPAFLFLCLKGAPEAFRHVAQVRSKYSLISVARMWSNVVQRGPNVSPMWPNAGGRNVAPNQSG